MHRLVTVEDIHRAGAGLRRQKPFLDEVPARRLEAALINAVQHLADPVSEIGRTLREELLATESLSASMTEWGLRTTAETITHGAFNRVYPSVVGSEPTSASCVAVVLSGNVFTASIRALCIPLALRSPVLAKASARDDLVPRAFARALNAVDSEVGAALEVLSFPRASQDLEDALINQADTVIAFGSDATMQALRARTPANVSFVAHGHGIGVGVITADALRSDDAADAAARAFSLDIAAYDQLGCLSPHVLFVETGGAISPRELAVRLGHALRERERELPRGKLSMDAGAAQLQWRSLAVTRGELFEGDGWSVSYEGTSALRISPGYRNLAVLDCASIGDLAAALGPLGAHLKVIGVAGHDSSLEWLAHRFKSPCVPRIVRAGSMQTPRFEEVWDAMLPWEGIIKWR